VGEVRSRALYQLKANIQTGFGRGRGATKALSPQSFKRVFKLITNVMLTLVNSANFVASDF